MCGGGAIARFYSLLCMQLIALAYLQIIWFVHVDTNLLYS